MGILLPALLSLFGKLPGMIGDYFKTKQEIKLQQITLDQQIQLQQLKNASDNITADSTRAITIVNSTAKWFKVFIFILISVPYIACLFNQVTYATTIFSNLAALPDWYVYLYTAIISLLLGIPVNGGVMDTISNGISEAVHNKRAFKLAKMNIDPKTYFDALRKSKGGVLTQADVDDGNKILDEISSYANNNNKT